MKKEIILEIKSKVVEGRSIYESMRETNQFSAYEYYSIQIGEETRKLEEVLGELQKYFNRKIQMKTSNYFGFNLSSHCAIGNCFGFVFYAK